MCETCYLKIECKTIVYKYFSTIPYSHQNYSSEIPVTLEAIITSPTEKQNQRWNNTLQNILNAFFSSSFCQSECRLNLFLGHLATWICNLFLCQGKSLGSLPADLMSVQMTVSCGTLNSKTHTKVWNVFRFLSANLIKFFILHHLHKPTQGLLVMVENRSE